MAIPLVDALDFNKNEAQNARLHNLAGAPSSPAVGQLYLETTSGANRLYYWNGSAWVNRATDSDLLGGQTLAQVRDFAQTTGTRDHNAISDFDTQVRLSRLDQLAVPTAAVSLNSQKITSLANGTNPNDAVNLAQVQSIQTGLDTKQSARLASTANVTVTYTATGGTSGRGQITVAPNTLDGIALVANDRILLKDQTAPAQNGIWVVTTVGTGANGVWDRAGDFDSDAEVTSGAYVFITEGATNDNTGWQLTTNDPITIGGASGTGLTWAQFNGIGSLVAGAGITKTGNQVDVGAANGIIVNADSIQVDPAVVGRKFVSAAFGDGASLTYIINHALNNQWVAVQIWETSGLLRAPLFEARATDANNVTIYFTVAPSSGAYRAVVVG